MLALQEPVDGLGVKGFGEVVALAELTARLAQDGQLLGRLDPFGDGLQVEGLAQGDDRPRQGGRLGAAGDAGDKGAVDLEDVDGSRWRQLRDE